MSSKALQIRKKLHRTTSAERDATVERYIASLDSQRRKLAQPLREIILSASPNISESLKFKIPFYNYFGLLCYINPVKSGIALGFCNGAMLKSERLSGAGKQVRHLIFKLGEEPDEHALKLILDALEINETLHFIKSQKRHQLKRLRP
jgi:hypothetical protein